MGRFSILREQFKKRTKKVFSLTEAEKKKIASLKVKSKEIPKRAESLGKRIEFKRLASRKPLKRTKLFVKPPIKKKRRRRRPQTFIVKLK